MKVGYRKLGLILGAVAAFAFLPARADAQFVRYSPVFWSFEGGAGIVLPMGDLGDVASPRRSFDLAGSYFLNARYALRADGSLDVRGTDKLVAAELPIWHFHGALEFELIEATSDWLAAALGGRADPSRSTGHAQRGFEGCYRFTDIDPWGDDLDREFHPDPATLPDSFGLFDAKHEVEGFNRARSLSDDHSVYQFSAWKDLGRRAVVVGTPMQFAGFRLTLSETTSATDAVPVSSKPRGEGSHVLAGTLVSHTDILWREKPSEVSTSVRVESISCHGAPAHSPGSIERPLTRHTLRTGPTRL